MARRVIVLEDRAHWSVGHFPSSCASLARGLAACGCDVQLHTMAGWRADGGPEPFRVTVASKTARAMLAMAARAGNLADQVQWWPARVATHQVAAVVRAAGLATMVRQALRHRPDSEVVSFVYDLPPIVACAAFGGGRMVHSTLRPPPRPGPPETRRGRLVDATARAAERRRRRRGGGMRLGVATDALLGAWQVRAPFLDPVVLPHATSRPEAPHDRAAARAEFGIGPDAQVALVFGAVHGRKDLDTVWSAFRHLPDWTLLVVGQVADHHAAARADGAPPAVTRAGFVDDGIRAAAYSAADVCVLSFVPDHIMDSGVLQDAVTFGVPVVCSSGTVMADDVGRFRLGAVFAAGDPAALADAVPRARAALDGAGLADARAASSHVTVARRYLDALDGLPVAPPSPQTGRK